MEMEDIDNINNITPAAGVTCDLCGSDKFVLEGGYFFCQICQTQSQDAREYVEREEFRPGNRDVRSSTFRRTGTGSRSRGALENLSTFQAFNCCLKITTDHIIDMGFPTTLRNKLFNLWTKFLIRRKAVFTSVLNSKINCRMSAASVWVKNRSRLRPKHKLKPCSILDDPNEDHFLSASIQKRKRTLAQRKAMEMAYHSSFEFLELMDEVPPTDGADTLNKIKRKVVQRQRQQASKLTKQSKQLVWALRREGLSHKRVPRLLLQPEIFTMKSLLALIFISLRQIGCKILMTDVVRMVWSGSVHFSSLRLILGEESANVSARIDKIFSNSTHNYLSTEYSDSITSLITYLGITDFRYPSFDEFLPKFIDDLNLPRELECLILQMQKSLPADSQHFFEGRNILSTYHVLPEFHITSVIIVLLRLLFGLDDITERYQSQFAKVVNSILTSRDDNSSESDAEWTQLFVIEDWFSYLRQRKRISKTELFNPSFYDMSKNPSCTAADNFVETYTGYKGTNFLGCSEEEKRLETTQMFIEYAKLSRPASIMVSSRGPGDSCILLPQNNLPRQYKANQPFTSNQNFSTKSDDTCFMRKRIDFVLKPKKYVKLLQENGYRVRVLSGDARYHANLISQSQEEGTILLFQPFKLFDDHMPKNIACPLSLKCILELCSLILCGSSSHSDSTGNKKFESLIESVQYYYSRHLHFGVLNVSNYEVSDDDAVTDSD